MISLFLHKKTNFNKALKALIFISGIFMFAYAMLMPIFAIFVEKIGGSVTTASNSWAIFWLVAGILTFVMGKLESKMDETELAIVWSQYIICIAYILYYFTTTTSMLYIVMIILGIGNAIFWPAFHSVYTKHVDEKNSTWQWSFYDGMAYIIPAIGAALGGFLVNLYGFNLIFIIMAILTFLNATFILFLPKKIL